MFHPYYTSSLITILKIFVCVRERLRKKAWVAKFLMCISFFFFLSLLLLSKSCRLKSKLERLWSVPSFKDIAMRTDLLDSNYLHKDGVLRVSQSMYSKHSSTIALLHRTIQQKKIGLQFETVDLLGLRF